MFLTLLFFSMKAYILFGIGKLSVWTSSEMVSTA